MSNGMVRTTPDLFRNSLHRFFDQSFGDAFSLSRPSEEVSNRSWIPSVDVRETDEALTLFVELPGMKREDVDITLENRMITLRGERKFEQDSSRESYHRIERAYGSFSRSFTLPSNVQTDQVNASFSDGLLTIELPKAEESKPRKIEIAG
ncbi:MAG: Hsp20/alpha crystallin family protein [Acidobacteriota bacterium]